MLKLINSPAFRAYVSLHSPSLYAFGALNKRNFVPKIMKDPKYTRQGIFKPKKKSYQYDLTQPHIQFPERYYDEKVDAKLERKAYLQRRKERKGYEDIVPETARPLNAILQDLTNEEVLARGSSRIILNIDEIESHYESKVDEDVRDIILRALTALNSRIHLKNLREVSIIATLNRKYGIKDKETWKNVKFALMKFFVKEENETIQLVDHELNEKNFVHTLNNILQVSRRIDLDISDLILSIEKNYSQKIDSFKNLQNLVVFSTTLANIPSQKKGLIWTSLDKTLAPRLNELNVLDALTLANSFAKAQVIPSFLDKLVEKFIADYNQIKDRKVEKLSVMAQALATLKKRDEKFNILAEREIEANLDQVNNITDARFIIVSFSRLGIKSKKVFEHCGNVLLQNLESLSLDNIEHLFKTFLPKNFLPSGFFKAIGDRVGRILEEDPYQLDKQKSEAFVKGLDRWTAQKMHEDAELVGKLRQHITYLG